jgi:hypothetical protein
MLNKLEYQVGLIKEESTSELLRFTIRQILNQACNQPDLQHHYYQSEHLISNIILGII